MSAGDGWSLEPITIVVNPNAGRGAVRRGVPVVRGVLDDAGVVYEVVTTERPGHATEAARAAVRRGSRLVVAVGGDGTVHEVVNGMMGDDAPLSPDATLGVVAAGSGCDFVRTFGLPQDPERAARHLLGESIWGRIDVVRMTYRDRDGARAQRWCANIAETGLGAEVVEAAARMPKWLGGAVYRLAALRSLVAHKPREVSLVMHARKARARVDAPLGDLTHRATASMVVVANGQFYGGGMRVAPRASPSDGMADVLVFTGSKLRAPGVMQKMSNGTHVPAKDVAEFLATRVEIDADPPMLVEADGELVGTTPATFEVVREAIPLKV